MCNLQIKGGVVVISGVMNQLLAQFYEVENI